MVGCIWRHTVLLGLETYSISTNANTKCTQFWNWYKYIFSVRLETVLPSRNALKMGEKSTLFSIYALPLHFHSLFMNSIRIRTIQCIHHALIPIGQFKWKSLLQFFGYLDRIPFSICMQNLWNKNRVKTWLNISQEIHTANREHIPIIFKLSLCHFWQRKTIHTVSIEGNFSPCTMHNHLFTK